MEWRTAFIGREREIATLHELLRRSRLLTMTGAGGIGKTRLAVEAIRRQPVNATRRVVTVELAPIRDPSQLLRTIGAAIGLRETGAIDPLSVLSEYLGRTPTLLLLDNFEHIVAAAPTVSALLDATPSVRVIVTSRVALHLSGEQEYAVPPMELPAEGTGSEMAQVGATEAVQLLIERARRVRPDFELTASNAAAVAEICRRLDGLPLAIELAASRLKALAPDALQVRLRQRLSVLTGGAADAPQRHQTLRATIAWSYELLGEGERSLLLRCAVFAGGFTLDALRAVTPEAASPEVLLDEVLGLVDHSLLTSAAGGGREPRFGMLETIREFALDQADVAFMAGVSQRHADHFLEVAETAGRQLQGTEHSQSLGRLTEELDNVRVAMDWLSARPDHERFARLAAAMAAYWRYYGSIREGQVRLDQALAGARHLTPGSRAKVTRAAGWLEAIAGNLIRGRHLLERSLHQFERIGDQGEIATTLYHLGATLSDLMLYAAARRRLDRGLEIAGSIGATAIQARLLLSLAMIAGEQGRLDERADLTRRAIDASRRAGDIQRLALALETAAWVAWDRGDRSEAIDRWNESVSLLRDWGERAFLGTVLYTLSYAHTRSGQPEKGRQVLLQAMPLIRQAGALPDVIAALTVVTHWLAVVGARDRAIAQWRTAEQIAQQNGIDPRFLRDSSLSWPMPEVDELMLGSGAESPDIPAHIAPVSLEEALDVAQRDVERAVVPKTRAAFPRGSRFDLTRREREVLQLIIAGRSNAEIGEALFISRKTASVHVANIKGKLGATSRVGIVTLALAAQLVDDPSAVIGAEG
jgi:predicted ATPase/DNA-binding CsgD family transcriptional regulator